MGGGKIVGIYGGGICELACDFKRFKKGILRKLVNPHERAPQVDRGVSGCPSTKFELQLQIIKLH